MEYNPASVKPLVRAIALAFVSVAAPAFAQQAAAPAAAASAPAAAPAGAAVLESVTVTAQGRTQALQDVPISVKTFSAKQIEQAGITSTQDFINLTPNVSFDQSFTFANSFITIRGVSQLNNADSPVAVVVDGVPQNNQKQLKMDLFDVQRIEVLKGPQGALFGRNAIGGAITIETKPPTNTLEGFGGLEVGNGSSVAATAGISGPIIDDKLLFRIAGESRRAGGLIENTYLDEKVDKVNHDNTLRAKLLAMPVDGLQLDFRVNLNDYVGGATWDTRVASGNANDIGPPRENILGRTEGRTNDFSFKANYGLAGGTLSAITSYTDLFEKYRGDIDFSNPTDLPGGFLGLGFQTGQGQNLGVKLTSQEIRFTSADNAPFRWIAGGLVLNTKRDLQTRVFVDTNSQLSQYDNGTLLVDRNEHNDNNAYSLFGQIEQDLPTATTVALGLRYDRDDRHQIDDGPTAASNPDPDRKKDFNSLQPKVTLTQHIAPSLIGYATYSTGFRSGGFNAPGLPEFKAENLQNLEAGMKSTLLDKRLILDGSFFYANSKNFQYFYVNAASGAQMISNLDRVHITGVDIDFQYLPIAGLQFDGGLGTTNSKIKEDSVDPTVIGHYTPKAVPLKATLGIQYTAPVAADMTATARFDVEHRSKKYWQINNADTEDALNLINLRIALSQAKDRWSVYLFGKNLTDKKYYADFNPAAYSGLGYAIGSLAQPRTFGIGAKVRF